MNDWLNKCHFGDCIETMRGMPDGIVNTCVTSPPYFGLRDYGHAGQIGLEETPAEFVAKLVEVFREVRRVLRDDGTLWLNLGDSYAANRSYQVPSTLMNGDTTNQAQAGSGRGMLASDFGLKPKDLIGIPWRVALALQADGWYLRQDIIWHKPNPMPESVTDRCTKAHEYIFLLSKSATYHYDHEAVKEPASQSSGWAKQRKAGEDTWKYGRAAGGDPNSTNGIGGTLALGDERNKRSVWTVATQAYSGAHFATFPTALIEPCILAGAPAGGVVLDPFFGSGTTGQVAQNLGRQFIGCELNPAYEALQTERLRQMGLCLEAA
jgi:site-specific DNA-methyltransferase (cytosine-N4-specific)